MGFNSWPAIMGPLCLCQNVEDPVFSSSSWLTSCLNPHPFKHCHSSNPYSHPAGKQSWTNMELNREIQSEYKQVMFQMNNTLSIPALPCNKNSHVFLWLHWERLFAWFLCATDNTTPLIVWITHYNVYSLPFCGLCEPSLFKFNTFGYQFRCWV